MKLITLATCLLTLGASPRECPAAEIPHMSCNMTTDFGMQLVGCVFRPFKDLIDMIPFSYPEWRWPSEGTETQPHAKYRGFNDQQTNIILNLRKSRTVADVFRVVHRIEQNEFEKVLTKLTPPDQDRSEDATTRRMLMEHVLKTILSNVDFDQVIDAGLLQLLGTAGALRSKLMEFRAEKQISLPMEWDQLVQLICLVEPHLCKMATCLPRYNETSLEDDITFVQCFFIREDLPIISSCMRDAFEGCEVGVLFKLYKLKLDWIADLIMRVFIDILGLNDYMLKTNIEAGKKYEVKEGVKSKVIKIQSMVPPGVHCFRKVDFMNTPLGAAELLIDFFTAGIGNCNVEIQLSTSNYIRDLVTLRLPTSIDLPLIGPIKLRPASFQYPMCRSGHDIPQYVIGWHEYANESSGIIKLTNENWNETFSINIDATIDYKVAIDPASKFYQQDFLTLKVRAKMDTKFSSKIELNRVDSDVYAFRTCWILNGPHLRTFDGHYYNNFYEGHFVLYRHKKQPYEVQVVTQACSRDTNSTCACAASVRSGNDVFSVDWCRRRNQSPDDVTMKVALYLIGDLTNGTRVFRHDEGLTYKVLLPHGILVTITATEGRLNVWIRPSAYDKKTVGIFGRNQVEGLCGNFDGSIKGELLQRDGKVYMGPGTGSGQQPQGFNKDWRVTDMADVILRGLNGSGDVDVPVIQPACACSHVILMGIQCQCGNNMLVSDCDINTDGELPELFPLISQYSRPMFHTDHPDQAEEDLIDFSDGYMTKDPMVYNWKDNNETIDYCQRLIQEDPVQLECKMLIEDMTNSTIDWMSEIEMYQRNCERDAQLSGADKDWSLISKMAARQHCHDMLDLTSLYSDEILQPLYDIDCPNDCNPGINNVSCCINGTCLCDAHHSGPDCSLPSSQEPIMLMPKFSACDTRYQNCSYVTVYGKNFVKDKVFCHHAQSGITIRPHILTASHLACKLPSNTSFDGITITVTSKPPQPGMELNSDTEVARAVTPIDTGSFDFVAFDSLCFVMDANGKLLERQATDHCFVEKVCYTPEQTSAGDACYVCHPNVSISQLVYSTSEPCVQRREDEKAKAAAYRREWNLRYIVSSILCGLVIAITIIAFIASRHIGKKSSGDTEGSKTAGNGDVHEMSSHNAVFARSGLGLADDEHVYRDDADVGDGIVNTAVDLTTEPNGVIPGSPGNQRQTGSELKAREIAEFWYIKHMAAQRSRMRADSQGSRASSIGSRGIGGSGASHFSARTRSSTAGSVGIGATGPAHLGRFAARSLRGENEDDESPELIGMGGGGAVAGLCVRL